MAEYSSISDGWIRVSDLESIDNQDYQASLEDIAKFQPKPVDDKTRPHSAMKKSEWLEIVQWLAFRFDSASKWEQFQIDVFYSDLQDYTKADVFAAVKALYEEGRVKAPEGSLILAKLKSLNAPKIRQVTPEQIMDSAGGKCDIAGYYCQFTDHRWSSDDYGNWHFKVACMANGDQGLCEKLKPAVPNEGDLAMKPTRETRGSLYRVLAPMKLSIEMKAMIWKTYEKYADGDIEVALKEIGKANWYE